MKLPLCSLTIENVLFTDSDQQERIIYGTEVNKNTVTMSKLSTLDLLMLKRMYAPHGVKCCRDHL